MTFTDKSLYGIVALAGIFVFYSMFFSSNALAGAPSGLPATVATTSQQVITSTASLVFATSTTNCAARIVSATASGHLMISFSDLQGIVPTATLGHIQATSTTVAYDSGIYGCGAMRIYSPVTQTITVTQTN